MPASMSSYLGHELYTSGEKKKKEKVIAYLFAYVLVFWGYSLVILWLRRSSSCPTHFLCVYASLLVKTPPARPPLTHPTTTTNNTCACNRHMHSTIILTTYMRHVMASCDVRCIIINSGYYMGWCWGIFFCHPLHPSFLKYNY